MVKYFIDKIQKKGLKDLFYLLADIHRPDPCSGSLPGLYIHKEDVCVDMKQS